MTAFYWSEVVVTSLLSNNPGWSFAQHRHVHFRKLMPDLFREFIQTMFSAWHMYCQWNSFRSGHATSKYGTSSVFKAQSLCHQPHYDNHERQCTRYNVNIETRSGNHICSGKAMSITQSECVSAALGIQHAMRMRQIAICGLPPSTKFFHIISQRHDLKIRWLTIKCVFRVSL